MNLNVKNFTSLLKMNKILLLMGLIIAIGTDKLLAEEADGPQSQPQSQPQTVAQATTPLNPTKSYDLAVGVNAAWSIRQDYGANTFRRFEPELVGFLYSAFIWDQVWLRHGTRLSYSNDQPQMPQSFQLDDTDWKASVEEGIIWSWYLVPSFTLGVGYDWRTTKVKTAAPITSVDDRLSSKNNFWWYYTQLGIGLPILDGKYMIEPLVRWQHLMADARTNWAFGLEISVAW